MHGVRANAGAQRALRRRQARAASSVAGQRSASLTSSPPPVARSSTHSSEPTGVGQRRARGSSRTARSGRGSPRHATGVAMASAPTRRSSWRTTPQQRIYVLGGEDASGEPVDSVLVFEMSSGTWLERPAMPDPAQMPAAALAGDAIYIFGGVGPKNPATVQVFDLRSQTWTSGPPMPVPLADAAVVTLDETMYLFGGSTPEREPSAAALRFDPAAASWTRLPDMPGAGTGLSAVIVDTEIWVIGISGGEDYPADGRPRSGSRRQPPHGRCCRSGVALRAVPDRVTPPLPCRAARSWSSAAGCRCLLKRGCHGPARVGFCMARPVDRNRSRA